MAENKVRVGGLWRQKSRNGVEYLSGRFGQARMLVFRNDRKSTDSAPDFTVYLAEDERETRADAAPEPARTISSSSAPTAEDPF